MSELSFRIAQPADAAAIVAVVNAAYRGDSSRAGWTTEADLLDGVRTHEAEIVALIKAPGSMILLCFDGGMLLGSVHLQPVIEDGDPAAFLGMFSVNPGLQAKGIGKRLMAGAEAAWVGGLVGTK